MSRWDGIGEARYRPRRIQKPADQIRVAIVEAILSGHLKPGDRLPGEIEQAKGYGVSRSMVREAISSLSSMGLVTVTAGRHGGAFVNRLDSGPVARNLLEAMQLLLTFDAVNVGELLEARRGLEELCARLAARRSNPEELDEIKAAVEESKDASVTDDEWLRLDIRFHHAVAVAANNRVLLVPLTALQGIVQPHLNYTILPFLDRGLVNHQHGEIYEGIASGQPEQASQAVDTHLRYLQELYQKAEVA